MNLLVSIRTELNKHADPVYRAGAKRFFKEPIHPLGVRAAAVRKIARDHFPKGTSKADIFALAESLLKKKTFEETIIAFSFVYRMKEQFEKKDFRTFERWIKTYVTNWAFCDDFCTHSLGKLLSDFPELVPKVKAWTKSKNRWMRRAAAVSFIYPIKKKRYLKDVFAVADALLEDPDDMVQKGYGWMLKVTADIYPGKVFAFVLKRKHRMPRTALRYAIEKMPSHLKGKAMGRV